MVTKNEALKPTLDMIRSISKASDIKISRGYTDFLADRIIIAATEPNLLAFVERLSGLMNATLEYIGGNVRAAFIANIAKPEADYVLAWMREYPRVAAMIVTLYDDGNYKESIELIEIEKRSASSGVALPQPKYDIPLKITCLSPLAHGGDNKAGNTTLFRRMQVLSQEGGILTLPFYSGNAIRGQMRDLLGDHYLSALGLIPSKSIPTCSLWFFYALYTGGKLEENSAEAKALGKKMGSSGALRTEGMREFRNMIPPLSVLGTAIGNRIISGRLNFGDAKPRCKEWGTGEIPAAELFEFTFLTRREDCESHADGENHAMIANSECLRAGTILDAGIDFSEHVTDIERACIGKGLNLLKENGYLGAENRRGFGNVQIDCNSIPDPTLYETYLTENRQAILDYLTEIEALNAPNDANSASTPQTGEASS